MIDIDGYWSETASGRKYYPTRPNISDIAIEDIAHSAGFNCRYNGHCKQFYSVATHCLIVLKLCEQWTGIKSTLKMALMHDASESYIHDIITPLKRQLPEYVELESKWMKEIIDRFDIAYVDDPLVKEADAAALRFEALHLMPSKGEGWQFEKHREFSFSGLEYYLDIGLNAKDYFLKEWKRLNQ